MDQSSVGRSRTTNHYRKQGRRMATKGGTHASEKRTVGRAVGHGGHGGHGGTVKRHKTEGNARNGGERGGTGGTNSHLHNNFINFKRQSTLSRVGMYTSSQIHNKFTNSRDKSKDITPWEYTSSHLYNKFTNSRDKSKHKETHGTPLHNKLTN